MSKGMTVLAIIAASLFAFGVINITQNLQTGNELDYYVLKETTEAAMTDAVDLGYYRISGLLRIDKEMFAESFIRRFAENVANDRTYKISMYDINETPPKVTVDIDSKTSATFSGDQLNINNRISAVLESKYQENKIISDMIKEGKLDYDDIDKTQS